MIVDYHMHMRGPLADGSEPLVLDVSTVERYCEVAAARGVDEIAFTEHVYYFAQTRDVWWLPYQRERCVFDLDRYVEAVLEGRRRGLPVKLGLEVDWVGPRQAALAEALAAYPWDVLLGSVHWLGDVEVDLQPGIWATTTVDDAWRRYVDALCELVGLGLVDVVAHPDLAKIFGDRPDPGLRAELDERLADAVAAAGLAAEISTAGLRKPVGEPYPDEGLLRAFHARGVPITLASDAHVVEYVGHRFAEAVELARRVGYETVSVFDGRRRTQAPLG